MSCLLTDEPVAAGQSADESGTNDSAPLAQASTDGDDDQRQLRENPDFAPPAPGENTGEATAATDYAKYPFLNLKANAISYNGSDPERFKTLLTASADTLITILHIGDSHIQAEGSTSRTRALLQNRCGSGGRGLIIPFRLAGTNQPLDYSITSSSRFTSAKLMKQPWSIEMGFSGVSLKPLDRNFDMTISAKTSGGISPAFNSIRIFCTGSLPRVTLAKNSDGGISITQENCNGYLDVFLDKTVETVTLNFTSEGACTLHAFDLDNAMAGVKYSAIGNNGATYSSYNALGSIGRDISALEPDLIILSMGANEAFGKVTDTAMRSSIDLLVKNIRRSNPGAQILLTTPADCQRSVRRRVKTRRRRRYRTVRTYQHNENIARLRNVILAYGRDNNIATYDWYAVAGGDKSSVRWIADGLMSKDRIHLTWKGYKLMGELFYDALVK